MPLHPSPCLMKFPFSWDDSYTITFRNLNTRPPCSLLVWNVKKVFTYHVMISLMDSSYSLIFKLKRDNLLLEKDFTERKKKGDESLIDDLLTAYSFFNFMSIPCRQFGPNRVNTKRGNCATNLKRYNLNLSPSEKWCLLSETQSLTLFICREC